VERIDQEGPEQGITSPDEPTHEATSPPDNPDADADAVDQAGEKLDQAGGGH
jgi:hypothetical protein